MRVKYLINAPQWLKDATVYNEDVEMIDGYVTWKGGVWKGGVWKGGFDTSTRCCLSVSVNYDKQLIRFGCRTKTIEGWQKVYDAGSHSECSEEQFERLKVVFNRIKKTFEI